MTRTLSRLVEAHRSVLEKARAAKCTCPEAIQNLGVALELHRTLLDCLPASARSFLDDHVVDAIRADGASIAENLEHLGSVAESEPDSLEIANMTSALLERIQHHLEWNDRAVFRPLRRFYLETASSCEPAAPSSTGEKHDRDL